MRSAGTATFALSVTAALAVACFTAALAQTPAATTPAGDQGTQAQPAVQSTVQTQDQAPAPATAPPAQAETATAAQSSTPTATQIPTTQVAVPSTDAAASQAATPSASQAPPTEAAAPQPAPATQAQNCPGNPSALGTSRVLTISPADIQHVGTMQYPQSLPLEDHEVVLTFDDGPLPPSTTRVLDVLASQCVKATFFIIGEMAHAYPDTLRRVHNDGHTIGTHSQDHPINIRHLGDDRVRWEIEQGIASVAAALGDPMAVAPFFRIPGLERSAIIDSELDAHGLVTFSTDVVADDWHRHITPSEIIDRAMRRLEARGRGILLLHDIHPWTATALPGLLAQLKEHGFRIVHVVPAPGAMSEVVARMEEPTVDFSVAAQSAMDDSKAEPNWPQAAAAPTSRPDELPSPDAQIFGTGHVSLAAAKTGDIEANPALVAAGNAMVSWPGKETEALTAAGPQLPAPDLQDIGWPVVQAEPERRIAEAEPPPEAKQQYSHAAYHHRTRHAHLGGRRHARAGGGHHADLAPSVATMSASAY